MSLSSTPKANRIHIAFFGRRNVGKSSLINALTNQELSIVSNVAGTTTDPVEKAMEILPLGPVVLIDTAGLDDEGELGALRVEKTLAVFKKTDVALLVLTAEHGFGELEQSLVKRFQQNKIGFIIVYNKSDEKALQAELAKELESYDFVSVSAKNKKNISSLKGLIIKKAPDFFEENTIVGDLVSAGDTVVLVVPIDTGMPKNRLILPQVQTIRDLLDHDAMAYVCKERELKHTLSQLQKPPKLVITDSHAFAKVDADTPLSVPLTSFSILFSRYKGELESSIDAVKAIKKLKANSRVLIAEACTHHAQPDDLGKVKIPRWLKDYLGIELSFDFCAGRDFPDNLEDYDLVIQCGGCMLNRREMLYRIFKAKEAAVPIINYGIIIAFLHGILKRSVEIFGYEEDLED